MSTITHFDGGGFARALAGPGLWMVAFWAPWCGPCQAFASVFEAAAADHDDVRFGKINVDEQPALAEQFGVRSIPMLMGVRDGVVLYLQAGALSEGDLATLVGHLLSVDMGEVHAALASQQGDKA
ncbi:MAG: thioredoxin family protein [Pseudomonadota bacterium]